MLVITVTKAARNLEDCVNRAPYRQETFVLLKNGVPFARLVPELEKACSGKDLATALARVNLGPAEARAWNRDRKAARVTLKTPRDKPRSIPPGAHAA